MPHIRIPWSTRDDILLAEYLRSGDTVPVESYTALLESYEYLERECRELRAAYWRERNGRWWMTALAAALGACCWWAAWKVVRG